MNRALAPWSDIGATWYAALESGGRPYGLARRAVGPDGTRYDVLDRTTGGWLPSPIAGAGYFTGIGGVTDAVPIGAAAADELRARLVGSPVSA